MALHCHSRSLATAEVIRPLIFLGVSYFQVLYAISVNSTEKSMVQYVPLVRDPVFIFESCIFNSILVRCLENHRFHDSLSVSSQTMAEQLPQYLRRSDDSILMPMITNTEILTAVQRAPPSSISSKLLPPTATGFGDPFDDAAEFQDRLDSLPRELYDMVKGYTLSAHIGNGQLLFHLSLRRRSVVDTCSTSRSFT